MSFVIRDATTVDIPNIIEAYQWLFQSPGGVPPGWDETRARESIAETIEGSESTYLVAIHSLDARLAGICSAYMDINSVRYGRRCWIEDLAVAPEMRSKGLGRQLIGEVRTWARERGATHLELDTGKARDDARRFYEQLEPDQITIGYGWNLAPGAD
ncbi:MAG: GNAT family N-acetyltransferase [Solirubrobacterales bacterium]|nr:GNAT family N-acetyltransferase [Solirubrobacterales bacterium]HMT06220.1 GNAT family N-acetyltransferase [Solirubrobacterales bacterium]